MTSRDTRSEAGRKARAVCFTGESWMIASASQGRFQACVIMIRIGFSESCENWATAGDAPMGILFSTPFPTEAQ